MAVGTPAITLLRRLGVPHTVHEYTPVPNPEGYGESAAQALGVDPDRLFKTLIATVDGALVCGVVPVSGHLDLKHLARAVGGKRGGMADAAVAQRATGYVLGGISPFGQRTRIPVVVDASAAGFATVFVSAGRRGLQVELDRLTVDGGDWKRRQKSTTAAAVVAVVRLNE